MIRMGFSGTIQDALMTDPFKTVNAAMRRAIERSLRSTKTKAARQIAKETKIKAAAIQRGIKVSRPYGSATSGWEAQISAKEGEKIPLSGYQYKVRTISRALWRRRWQVTTASPLMQRRQTSLAKRGTYQLIDIKFYGKSSFQYVPGAFRAVFRSNGGKHVALAMRRGKKRLPLREMFTKYPDVALWLVDHEKELAAHATERIGIEFKTALEFYRKQEAKKLTTKGK